MSGTLIQATNLLGDTFYLLKPLKLYLQTHPEVKAIIADPGLAYEMIYNCFGAETDFKKQIYSQEHIAVANYPGAEVIHLGAGMAADLSYKLHRDKGGDQLHISEAYARLLGITNLDIRPNMDWTRVAEPPPRTFFAISPFSRSCSRHSGETPNKTLDDHKWEYIIRYLRRQGVPVKVMAGPNDRLSNNSVPVNDYFTAKNLYELEYFLRSCALLITLDNGLGHLASALHTPMISLWPKVSNLQFIGPRFSRLTNFVQMEPNSVTPSQLLAGIRHFARPRLGGERETKEELLREE